MAVVYKTTMTCDRCGKEVEDNHRKAFYIRHHRSKIVFGKESWSTDNTYDLCEDCADKFRFDFMHPEKS